MAYLLDAFILTFTTKELQHCWLRTILPYPVTYQARPNQCYTYRDEGYSDEYSLKNQV
jgi:hypothetical protein